MEFQHNPLIGAVRPRESITGRLKDLMNRPPCGPKERARSKEDRLTATQRVVIFHQPSAIDLDLYTSIDNCLRWGYVCRNPLSVHYGNDLDLEEYIDIRPLRECDYPGFDITPEKIAPAQAPAPKESLLQDVVFRLSMIGISKAEAQARALAVMDQMPNCKDPITIAKSALAPVLAQPNPTLQSENPLIKASSYQDLEKSGLVESSSVQEGVA